jgi:iron(III) transport system ATP-binding protein
VTAVTLGAVGKTHGSRWAVREASLDLAAGERLVLVGPSGCGKTTILRLIAGLITPDLGTIALGGRTVAEPQRNLVPPEDRNVGFVFQDLALWPHLTVAGNLEFGLKAKGVPRRERDSRVRELLTLVELEGYGRTHPGELSGGQQRRVALARALATRPSVLLMDEPLANLDEELNARLREEIVRLQERLGFALLYVTHNREEAAAIASRIVGMRDGRLEPPA